MGFLSNTRSRVSDKIHHRHVNQQGEIINTIEQTQPHQPVYNAPQSVYNAPPQPVMTVQAPSPFITEAPRQQVLFGKSPADLTMPKRAPPPPPARTEASRDRAATFPTPSPAARPAVPTTAPSSSLGGRPLPVPRRHTNASLMELEVKPGGLYNCIVEPYRYPFGEFSSDDKTMDEKVRRAVAGTAAY